MMIYEIRIKGQLDCGWADWFDGLQVATHANGETALTGPIADQAALYGVLKKIRDLGMPLLAVVPANFKLVACGRQAEERE